jgi:three-Cys-motif partner protein
MAAPTQVVWELEAHTLAKHAILGRYLQAWAPILSFGGFPQVLYIDGFAGPGRYSKGEVGSPVIALRSALAHAKRIKAKIMFLFVERDPDRARVLAETVEAIERPDNFHVKVAAGQTFEDAFAELHAFYMDKKKDLPPTFAFIDPFGWKGTPFSSIKTILSYPSCEVLITFMYEELNRFLGHPDQTQNFDSFFGTPNWREGIAIADPKARYRFLRDLYFKQLCGPAAAKYVRSFEMRNEQNRVDYLLFYATNSLKGLQKMKEAMWSVDESGAFTFSDATNPDQMILFAKSPPFADLRRQILERFKGSEASVGEVEEFVLAETAFRETHYKVHVLKDLEGQLPPLLEVINAQPGRRRGTFPDKSLRLRFSKG